MPNEGLVASTLKWFVVHKDDIFIGDATIPLSNGDVNTLVNK